MTQNLFYRLFWAIVLVALQIFVFGQVCLFGYATPAIYVYILCLLPLSTPRYAWLLWGFFVGLMVDMFSYSPGLGAASMTLTAMVTPLLLRLYIPKDTVEDHIPSFKLLSKWKYIWFVSSVVLFHQACFVLLEFFSFFRIWDMITAFLSSSLMTIIILLLFAKVREPQ
ncbi:MAG: rod shape-determining protein MreD [Paraprevotella sp.]|nr:rod shape-determining protein MreD [Paraprevotella sp.]